MPAEQHDQGEEPARFDDERVLPVLELAQGPRVGVEPLGEEVVHRRREVREDARVQAGPAGQDDRGGGGGRVGGRGARKTRPRIPGGMGMGESEGKPPACIRLLYAFVDSQAAIVIRRAMKIAASLFRVAGDANPAFRRAQPMCPKARPRYAAGWRKYRA